METPVTEARLGMLRQMPVFGGITDEVLQFLLRHTRMVTHSPGDYFFSEDDPAEEMYVLEQGQVEILRHWEGAQYCIGTLAQGDCFGEMGLIDLCRRSASVLATSECQAIGLSVSVLRQLYEQEPAQYTLIYMNLARELSRRLRRVNDLLLQTKVHVRRHEQEANFPT